MNIRKIIALTYAKINTFVNWRQSYYIKFIEPTLYLVLFGAGFTNLIGKQMINGHPITYMQFLFAGLVAMQSFGVFSFAIFRSSNDVKWGMYRLFVLTGTTPLDYMLAMGLISWLFVLAQWLLLIIAAMFIIGGSVIVPGVIMVFVSLPGVLFWSSLGVLIGVLVHDYGTRDLLSSVVSLPIIFSSTALYNLDSAPAFLRFLSTLNPLTYQANSLRLVYINNWGGIALNSGILLLISIILLALAHVVLPRANLANLQRG